MQNNDARPNTNPSNTSLREGMLGILEQSTGKPITVGYLINNLGAKSFGVLLAILSLPSALPVPAPGYSTPFGIAIILIAAQMILGRHTLWLPGKILSLKLNAKLITKMLNVSISVLSKIEPYVKPRLGLFHGKLGQSAIAINLILLASLMVLPIPMTNTLPAMVIFLIAVSLSENDGLVSAIGILLSYFVILFYGYLISLIIIKGSGAVDSLFSLSEYISLPQ